MHVWSSRSIVVPINLTSSWRHLVVTSSSSWHRMVVLLSSSLRTVLSSCVILSWLSQRFVVTVKMWSLLRRPVVVMVLPSHQ